MKTVNRKSSGKMQQLGAFEYRPYHQFPILNALTTENTQPDDGLQKSKKIF
jgi:hypothetical protein